MNAALSEFCLNYATRLEKQPIAGRKLFTGRADIHTLDVPEGFTLVSEWGRSWYRKVWRSDENLAIITYCEGDLSIAVHETEESYQQELAACAEYYKTY